MLKLEIFETASITDAESVFDLQQAEKLRETAYEQGYAAGWQDALEHVRDEDAMRRIASEDALQSISFTYNEAHAALENAFLGLAGTMINKMIPEVMSSALSKTLETELRALSAESTRLPIRISCAPSAMTTLEPIISNVQGLEICLVSEPSYSDAQVSLSIGAQERMIDFDAVLEHLRDILVQTRKRQNKSEISYG